MTTTPPPPSRSLPQGSAGDVFLRTASNVFLELLTFSDLLETIMGKVIEVTGATKGFLILIREDRTLDFRVARNMRREEIENPSNRISRTLIREVVRQGQVVMTPDAQEDPRFQDVGSVHNLLLKSILCVPLRNQREVFGVIYLENHITAGVFTAKHREMVQRLAEQASFALDMTRALESLKGERDRLQSENRELIEAFSHEYESHDFLGRSSAMRTVAAQMARLADSEYTVLLHGESGTGKELVARILHATGPRRAKPFVTVNCPTIPASLFESELFGHVKGAFTGADRSRAGLVEAADGGTLFLDEVGDLPLELQPKLLRLLQEREYVRVGENEPRRCDIRVIAATHRPLRALVEHGKFREDLYFRLDELPLQLPPLRERPGDIRELAEHFLRQETRGIPGFTDEALALLEGFAWPGNIRQLRAVVRRAAVFGDAGEPITLAAIRPLLESREASRGDGGDDAGVFRLEVPASLPYRDALQWVEKAYMKQLLQRHPALSRGELAARVGLPKRTLFQKLRDLGMPGAVPGGPGERG